MPVLNTVGNGVESTVQSGIENKSAHSQGTLLAALGAPNGPAQAQRARHGLLGRALRECCSCSSTAALGSCVGPPTLDCGRLGSDELSRAATAGSKHLAGLERAACPAACCRKLPAVLGSHAGQPCWAAACCLQHLAGLQRRPPQGVLRSWAVPLALPPQHLAEQQVFRCLRAPCWA